MNIPRRARFALSSLTLGFLALAIYPVEIRAQFVVNRFQATALRSPPGTKANAMETEPDIAGAGDTLVVVWTDVATGGCRHRVGCAISIDRGASWSYAGNIAGMEGGFGEPSICRSASGTYFVASPICTPLKDVAVSRGIFDGMGLTWSTPSKAVTIEDDTRTLWPDLACDSAGSLLNLIYTHVWESSPQVFFSRVELVRSTDGGASWSPPVILSGQRSSGGRLATGPDDELHVVWVDHEFGRIAGRKSVDHGVTFGPEFVIGEILDNQGLRPPAWIPHHTVLHPTVFDYHAIDRPSVAVDRSDGPRRGSLYVTWTERGAGVLQPVTGQVDEIEDNDWYATENLIAIGQAVAGGIESADVQVDDLEDRFTFDGAAGTTVYISGTLNASYYPSAIPVYLTCGDDSTRLQLIDRFSALGDGLAVSPIIMTLPATGRYHIQVAGAGPISFSYNLAIQELTIPPGPGAQDHRDVILTSSADGGATWSPKVRVNDDPPRFDNAFPAVAVDGNGKVHVTWYDRRHTTDCGSTSVHTYWTWSADGGQTFAASARLSDQPSDYGSYGETWRVGSNQTLARIGDDVYALWSRMVGTADADVHGARLQPDGSTAILISGLAAEVRGAAIGLRWYVTAAGEIDRLRVYRSEAGMPRSGNPYEEIPVRPDSGWQEWADAAVAAGIRYRYWLEIVNRAGRTSLEGPIEAALPAASVRVSWGEIGPNPFERTIGLELRGLRSGQASVTVYDITGQRVARLHGGPVAAGNLRLQWDGRDHRGKPVPTGIYLVKANVNGVEITTRIVRVR